MTTDMATNVAKRLGLLAFNKKNPAFIAFGGGFLEHQPWYSGPRDPGGWRERLAWAAAYLELSDRLCGLLGLPLEPEEVASVQLCPCAGDEGCEQAEWDIATKGGGVFDLGAAPSADILEALRLEVASRKPTPDGPGWFYASDGEQVHPFRVEHLSDGELTVGLVGDYTLDIDELDWLPDPADPRRALAVPTAEEWVATALAVEAAAAKEEP